MFNEVPPPDPFFVNQRHITAAAAILWLDKRATLGLAYTPLDTHGPVAKLLVELAVRYGRNCKKMAEHFDVVHTYAAADTLRVGLLLEQLAAIRDTHLDMQRRLEIIDDLTAAYKTC